MMLRYLLCSIFVSILFFVSLINPTISFSEEEKKEKVSPLDVVVEKTLGKGVKIIRTENPENSPVPNWKQIRVWIDSVYGETPVLFYSTEDRKFIFAGSIFNASGENLTRKDVGETIPKFVPDAGMELNEDYMIGNKDARVKAVLWIGADPYSKELFETFYDLYNKNKDKVVLYIKFYPRSEPDMEKIKALTCFKAEALIDALKTIYNASTMWGSKEDLDAFKKTGNVSACNDELVFKDLNLASTLKLPIHPVAFINRIMLTDKATRENIMKLAGTELN